MNRVSVVLRQKGKTVYKISPDATVLDGLKLMKENRIGSLLIMDGDRIAGIFTERDYAWGVGPDNHRPGDLYIRDVMTKDVVVVTEDQTVNECMQLMTERRFRHLPVLDKEGHLIGLVSIGDILKDVIEELDFLVKQLTDYIHGAR